MRSPQLLHNNPPVPDDIKIVPSAAVMGMPKTGKTTLAESLNKKIGLVKLSLQNIVEEFCVEHRDKKILEILSQVKKGHTLTDEMAIDLIEKRVSMADCQNLGWVLDGFPTNRSQCELLNKRGLLPASIFIIKLSELEIKKRAINRNLKSSKLESYDYDWDIEVINERITSNRNNLM